MSDDPIRHLTRLLSRLPSIGEKSATRIVFALLHTEQQYARDLAEGIVHLVEQVHLCSVCCNLTEQDPCHYCQDSKRDKEVICVVEQVPDLMAIERTQVFSGQYHVLHGALAPLEGMTPDKLRIRELLRRLESDEVKEVILATNPTVEGDSTALYLHRLLNALSIKVTRIASGVPMGGDLEYIDRPTLARALQERRSL
jgi:recombination protein RecR